MPAGGNETRYIDATTWRGGEHRQEAAGVVLDAAVVVDEFAARAFYNRALLRHDGPLSGEHRGARP
jgi:hypothetical protein